jgi:CBS domain-containing protein
MATVQDILDKKGSFVAHISIKSTVVEATQEMNTRRIGAVVVCDDDRVVGIFSERDVLARVVSDQIDPAATAIGQVMTSPVACCLPETTLEECKGVMTDKRVRHLPVVKDNKLLGIITSGDIMAFEKAKHGETIKYLQEYIYGPYAIDDTSH